MLLGFIGVILSLVCLIWLAYRGHSVIALAPIAALIAVLFSGAPLLASYTQIFMPALGTFLINFFPLFLAGAIFGRLMTVSGYAEDIARWIPTIFGPKRAILVTTVVTALLTYGGVSAWVIAFTIVPIAKPLFKHANISMRLMPAAIALGIFTFATAALPGSPQIHNAIPTRVFGTTTFAAPLLGIIGAAVTFSLGLAWLTWRQRQLQKAGEGFIDFSATNDSPDRTADIDNDADVKYGAHVPVTAGATTPDAQASGTAASADAAIATATSVSARMSMQGRPAPLIGGAASERGSLASRGLLGLLPVLVVVGVNAAFVYLIAPRLDTSYLADEKFGATTLQAVLGVWSVTVALVVAGILIFALQPSKAKDYINSLNEGARNAVLPAFTTASEVGYGAVIASLAVFALLKDSLFNVSDNPLIIGVIATAVISGITGSSSGGLSITMQSFGEQLAQLASSSGISAEVMHRVIAMSSVSFDSLPHNGAIVTLLLVCGMTHRQGYKDIGVVTVLVPFAGVLTVLGLSLALPGVF